MNKEAFIMEHRKVTQRDELFAYVAITSLFALYMHAGWPLWPFVTATIWSAITIAVSYIRQWNMESTLYDDFNRT